jgi:hypothetical protein
MALVFFSNQGHQVFHDPCPDLDAYCWAMGVTSRIIPANHLSDQSHHFRGPAIFEVPPLLRSRHPEGLVITQGLDVQPKVCLSPNPRSGRHPTQGLSITQPKVCLSPEPRSVCHLPHCLSIFQIVSGRLCACSVAVAVSGTWTLTNRCGWWRFRPPLLPFGGPRPLLPHLRR